MRCRRSYSRVSAPSFLGQSRGTPLKSLYWLPLFQAFYANDDLKKGAAHDMVGRLAKKMMSILVTFTVDEAKLAILVDSISGLVDALHVPTANAPEITADKGAHWRKLPLVQLIAMLLAESYKLQRGVDNHDNGMMDTRHKLFGLLRVMFDRWSSSHFVQLCNALETPLGVWMTDSESLLSSISISLVRFYYGLV